MKRSIAIIFAILLCLPLLVLQSTISIEKYLTRREVKHRLMAHLENEDLVKISLSKNEAAQLLKWEKDNEFEFHGRMYDVVRFVETNTSITYWCWPDSEESYLNQLLSSVINQSSDNNSSEKSDLLISFLKSIYFVDKLLIQKTVDEVAQAYFSSSINYLSWISKSATPPPDIKYLT